MDADYLREVADLVLRFLHVVAGIAWIGASFYFIRLDLGLSPPAERADLDKGVAGEYWGVHGGGFYHSQKYKVAPRVLPEPLHWFKWEAYTTWLSGFALLVLLYWSDADTRLIDPSVADLSAWEAVGASALLLVGGWLVYDVACRLLRRRPRGRRDDGRCSSSPSPGSRASSSPRARPISRSVPSSARSWPPTSSSSSSPRTGSSSARSRRAASRIRRRGCARSSAPCTTTT